MKAENLDIRVKALEKGVTLVSIADRMGVSETAFFRYMRKPLSPEKRRQILDIIEDLGKGGGNG